jgi:rod shape-determining protein MreD
MTRSVIWAAVLALAAAILQSTLLSRISIFGVVPDLALLILVFSAYTNGAMVGQLAGFSSGILLDFLSAAPLGLNALIRTLIGALAGILEGAFFLDFFIFPMLLCAASTLLKALVLSLLHWLLSGSIPAYPLAAPVLWVELGLNTVIAPFLFALLKRVKALYAERNKR